MKVALTVTLVAAAPVLERVMEAAPSEPEAGVIETREPVRVRSMVASALVVVLMLRLDKAS